jgi:hypothetical protein
MKERVDNMPALVSIYKNWTTLSNKIRESAEYKALSPAKQA